MADPAFELAQATSPAVAAPTVLPQLTVESEPEDIKSPEEWADIIKRLQAVGSQGGAGGLGTAAGEAPEMSGPGPGTLPPGFTPAAPPPAPFNQGEFTSRIPAEGRQAVEAMPGLFGSAAEQVMAGIRANPRGFLRSAGALAGSAAGVPYGPPGVFAGGYIGELTGNQIANAIELVRGSDAPDAEKPGLMRQLLDDPATTAVAGTLLGRTLPLVYNSRLGWRPLMARLMRLPPNSAQLLQEAKDIGVDIGVSNVVGNQGFGGTVVNVFGRMPILGGSAKDAARQQSRQIMASYNDMFGEIAEKRGLQDIADEAFQYGTKRFEDIAVKAADRFNHALTIGQSAGAIVPSASLKQKAAEIMIAAQKMPMGAVVNLPKDYRQVLTSISKFPDKLSTVEISSLDATLENIARKNSDLRYPLLDDLRQATASLYDKVDHPATRLMKAANTLYKDATAALEDDMFRRFGTLKRNNFNRMEYKPGTMNADELGRMLEKLKGPNQAAELRKTFGDDTMQKVGKLKVDAAWDNATKEFTEGTSKIFHWKGDEFRKALGLNEPGGRQYRLTEELLRGTGVNMNDLTKFASVADNVARTPLADASTFVARSVILHGLRGQGSLSRKLMQAFATTSLAGGVASGHLAKSIAATAFIRWGTGAMVTPGRLQRLTQAMDATAGQQAQVQALYSLFRNDPQLFAPDAP